MQKKSKEVTILNDDDMVTKEFAAPIKHNDPMYEEVVKFINTIDNVSISMIQNKFKLGVKKATKIIQELEDNGLIGEKDENNYRKVLISTKEDS